MRKITDFIVEKRNIIFIIFIIITGICLVVSKNVNVNSDITKYLPNDSETKIGSDIMSSEFEEQKTSTLNVMFKDLTEQEKTDTYEKLSNIEGVSSVNYDSTEEYNNGDYTLYVINVDDYSHSKTAKNIYDEVKDNYDIAGMSGSINQEYKPVLPIYIIALAIGSAMVILTILSESYIEPWLYLLSIGIAVFINKGTNIIFPSVSNITDSIAAILQLALSMDYSIMLSNRYRQERQQEKNKEKAMKKALYDSFSAISSSSITTVVGLIALVFMSFTIGRDLGFVLAKGVFFSLISIFFCLPALLLLFDKQIINSKKKKVNFNLAKIGKYSYKTRWFQLAFMIIAFIAAFVLKSNLNISYTGSEQDIVGEQFPATNQIAIVYENKYEDIITEYCKSLENDEKANQVLCYGNTINEKLAYDELNQKFAELGQDTELEEYLIKIIYYNYYNKNNKDSMTLDEFIAFIKSDIYSNAEFSSSIDKNVKDNITLLENFATKKSVTSKKTINEIASILGLDETTANDLLILYNSKNINTKITISEFINFMLDEVSKNPSYSSSIDKSTLASLNKLNPFTNKSLINKEMTSEEIANTFGIDQNLVDQLFLFYRTTTNTATTMTINEFSTISLSLTTDDSFKDMFDEETITNLKLLKNLSDETFITQPHTTKELTILLPQLGITNINEDTLNLLFFYRHYLNNLTAGKYITTTKLSLNEFVNSVINDQKISSLLPASITNYKGILNTFTKKEFITTKLNRIEMYNILKNFGFSETDINLVYANIYKTMNPLSSDEEALNNLVVVITPYEYLSFVKTNLQEGTEKYNQVTLLINIMDLSYNKTYNIVPTYDYETLATYLKQISSDTTTDTISLGYGYYDYQSNPDNTKDQMSIKELINFIVTNKENPLLSSKLSNTEILLLGYNIVNNTETKYSYQDISVLINKDENTVKKIYNIADYQGLITTLSPYEFVNLILNNQNNDLLKAKIDKNTIDSLMLVKKIMNSTINNTKYSAYELASLFKSDKDTISLIISLYDSKYLKSNPKVSLIDFTNFMISDVLSNTTYSSELDDSSISKLQTINGLMKNTINNTKYNSTLLYNVLNKLSDDIDYNLIDLVYIYHGSTNYYDSSWKLTVEEIINYLNSDILTDSKYTNFIDAEMSNKITSAKNTIAEAKKLLVTDKYSRMIINSKYGSEEPDTFAFIEETKNKVGQNTGVYVIGDSPMALEISKTFNGELDYITVLTMIFIFIVVAFTFKDLLIPLLLVLIIQCAVYVTMTILSLTGTNVYFISLLIVQAILMGATIDYAIVLTTYYKESRVTMGVQDALINAYNKSIHTILSSSTVLIIVTLIVSLFADAIAAKICETISEGTICSVILIIFVLPGILSAFDKIICRKKAYNDTPKNID